MRRERQEGSRFQSRGRSWGPAEAARVAGALRQAGLMFGRSARVAAAAPGQMSCSFSRFGSQRLLLPSAWPPSLALRGRQIPLPLSLTGPRLTHVGGETPGSPLKPPLRLLARDGLWEDGSLNAFRRSGLGASRK